jgi:alpha-beta hydrolase superfamily lysophospholipase
MDNIQKLHIPVLLYYGTSDILISIEAIKSLAENGGPGIQLKEWDGLYHEPHNEKGKHAVFNYLNSWMSGVLHRMAGKEEE